MKGLASRYLILLTGLFLALIPLQAAENGGRNAGNAPGNGPLQNQKPIAPAAPAPSRAAIAPSLYVLGPGDEITVHQPNAEELDNQAARIDDMGDATLPLVGKVHVGGLTVDKAQALIASRLSEWLVQPNPVLSITEYRSQPVSVVGEVTNPGVIQLQGQKTLLETISLAGGLRPDAGDYVEITRELKYGPVPAGQESIDSGRQFSMSRIDLTALMNGRNPTDNVVIYPHDVVSVPRGEVIYVAGDVHKPGSFPLTANGGISVLQAISLAEGLGPQARPKSAKILRPNPQGGDKQEIPVNLSKIMSGKAEDLELKPRDILLVPDSTSKKAGIKAAEAAVQAATGIFIWRAPL